LVKDPATELAWQAEELLRSAAGDEAPDETVGGQGGAGEACHRAWSAWWRLRAADLDLTDRTGMPRPGFVAACGTGPGEGEGVLWVCGGDGRVRWRLDGLGTPTDFQWLPGNRVLLAQVGPGRVTEREVDGTKVWGRRAAAPVA